MGYFISILLFFPLIPPGIPKDGWGQWEFEFPNKATCEQLLYEERPRIIDIINKQLRGVPHEVIDIQCMTIEEVVVANTELGHKPEWQMIPKKKPNKPMI